MRVFVCGTHLDLIKERRAVLKAIRGLKHDHEAMEFFGARSNRPIVACLEEVRGSDLLIVIIGSKYGETVPGTDVSFTQAEYEEGYRVGKPCLVYLRDEKVRIEPRFVERGLKYVRLLTRFKRTLKSRHVTATFRQASDLALQVEVDLARLLAGRAAEAKEGSETSLRVASLRIGSEPRPWTSALYGSLRKTLDAVSKSVAEHLRAETCSVFLVAREQADCLKLVSQEGGRPQHSPLIPIRSVRKGGLTGHIANVGELFNDHGPSLRNNPYATGKPPQHLLSAQCFSLLAAPIKDRKGRLMGLLKVENKNVIYAQTPQGTSVVPVLPSDDVGFTKADETVARILANEIVLTLETLRITDTSRTLLRKLNESPTLQAFFDQVLAQGRRLTNADRGDVTWWNEEKQRPSVEAVLPGGKLKVGDLMPERSIVSGVITSGQERLITSVRGVSDYYVCDERTLSEVVVPVQYGSPPKTLGALNAEWFREAGYDEQDVETLRHLADFVALGANVIESKDREQAAAFREFCSVIDKMQGQTSPREVLRLVLQALVPANYDRARIFMYIVQEDAFECLDSVGVEPDGRFQGYTIKASSSKYAAFTLGHWQRDASARVRDPRQSGPDPHARGLKKPELMPWAVAPLVVMGKLYGYIAADNSETGRRILAKDLVRMDLFTTLTAQLIANLLKLPQKV